jgi:glycosyltransferase involved in cell wall biosynthesis
MTPTFSVIIPARNEEAVIGQCLESIRRCGFHAEVEIIVVLNRCTDRTQAIAEQYGAQTVVEDAKNLSRIRNAGAAAATGEILITLDADSTASDNMLMEIQRVMGSSRYIGGGVFIKPERLSLGILLTGLLVGAVLFWYGVSVGMFFCRRRDYLEIGGFDEQLTSAEDIDFAKRLKRLGASRGLRYAHLLRASITTSCRKFDRFGDWYFLRHPKMTLELFRGRSPRHADTVWYDFER